MFWGAEELATSWWADVGLFLFLSFCSEIRAAAADGSVKQTPSGCFPDRVLAAPSLPCPLRPPAGRASSGPWSVWLSKSFHRWTVRPLFCRSGTCWETRWVWPGSSAGCPGWAASCWGWPQTPGGERGQTDQSQYTRVFDVRMQVSHYILQANAFKLTSKLYFITKHFFFPFLKRNDKSWKIFSKRSLYFSNLGVKLNYKSNKIQAVKCDGKTKWAHLVRLWKKNLYEQKILLNWCIVQPY